MNNDPIQYHKTGCIAQAVKINLLSFVGKKQKKLTWAEATACAKNTKCSGIECNETKSEWKPFQFKLDYQKT